MARNTYTLNASSDLRFRNPNEVVPLSQLSGEYQYISAEALVASPFNEGLDMERVDEYAASMKENGLLEPIVVYDLQNGKYEILSGHMRFAAWCKTLGHRDIKAVVLPFEPDPIKRFAAHTEANTVNRKLSTQFWNSRVRHAHAVLRETGFKGSREEEIKIVSKMLNGISRAQLYRYENFEKLIPELRAFEDKGWISGQSMYAATSLDASQQKEIAARVTALYDASLPRLTELHMDFEITRDEFEKIVKEVKQGSVTEIRPRSQSTYSTRLGKAQTGFLKALSNAKTAEDKKEALALIAAMRTELKRIEDSLL